MIHPIACMKPIIFHVEAAGEFRPVELTFATELEVRRVRAWRKRTPATDAGEFAALAAKRWFYYTREDATVASLGQLRTAVRRNEHAAVAFLLVASAKWAKRYKFLALAYCRRSWCHHLSSIFLPFVPACPSPTSRFPASAAVSSPASWTWQTRLEWKQCGVRPRRVRRRFMRKCCNSVR